MAQSRLLSQLGFMSYSINIADFWFKVQTKVSAILVPPFFLKHVELRELLSSVPKHMGAFKQDLEKLLTGLLAFVFIYLSIFSSPFI